MIDHIVPYGYHYVSLYLDGSNVRAVRVLVCDDCGGLVVDYAVHDRFHGRIKDEKKK